MTDSLVKLTAPKLTASQPADVQKRAILPSSRYFAKCSTIRLERLLFVPSFSTDDKYASIEP